jgi:GDP-L-fucose synthase
VNNFFNNKNVLVTGGSGFVGTNLLLRLTQTNASLFTTINKSDLQIDFKNNISIIKADLTNKSDCEIALKDIDYVFMCAANTSGAAVMENTPLAHLTPNMIMNLNMLESAYLNKVEKFLFVSSNTVYPVTDYPVSENDVTNEFFYKYFIVAWMKRFTEICCEMYSKKIKKPMKVIVVRPANIFGPFDDFEWETSHVIPSLVRKIVEKHNPIDVWGDGNDLKEFIYIDDFIEGMLLAFEKLDGYDPINISLNNPVTIRYILDSLIKITKFNDSSLEFDETKPTMIKKRLIDNKKIIELGFKPKFSIYEGLEKTVNWYKNKI